MEMGLAEAPGRISRPRHAPFAPALSAALCPQLRGPPPPSPPPRRQHGFPPQLSAFRPRPVNPSGAGSPPRARPCRASSPRPPAAPWPSSSLIYL